MAEWGSKKDVCPDGSDEMVQWAVKDSCFLPFNCPVKIPSERWAFERPSQINKMFPAGIHPLPLRTAPSASDKQGVWGTGISTARSWGGWDQTPQIWVLCCAPPPAPCHLLLHSVTVPWHWKLLLLRRGMQREKKLLLNYQELQQYEYCRMHVKNPGRFSGEFRSYLQSQWA